MRDIFFNTRIPKVEESLRIKFPQKYDLIYTNAKELLAQELEKADDRGSRVIGNHLKKTSYQDLQFIKRLLLLEKQKKQQILL